MSQQSQGTNSSPIDLPMKRKRGRPRKDESLVHGENMNATPGPYSAKKSKVYAGTCEKVEDNMVGQVVSGVIDGSFDAGYLLNVKVGDTDTQLRGVVFLPGRFIPITPANDIVPHVLMVQRKEIPLPAFNQQTPPPGSTNNSNSTASGKQPASVTVLPAETLAKNDMYSPPENNVIPQQTLESVLEVPAAEHGMNHNLAPKDHAPIFPDQVPHIEFQSVAPVALDNQTSSFAVPLSDNLAKNNTEPSLEGNVASQQTSESGLEIPPSVIEQHVEPMNKGIFSYQDPPVEIHCIRPMELDKQSASKILSLAVNSENNDIGSFMEGSSLPQQSSVSGFELYSTIQDNTQSIQLNSNAKILPGKASFMGLQLGTQTKLDKQPRPSSDVAPLAENLPEKVLDPFWEGKLVSWQTSESGLEIHPFHQCSKQQPVQQVTPFDLQSAELLEAEVMTQQSLLSELGNQSAPLGAQVKFYNNVEHDEVLQDFESSTIGKSLSTHVDVLHDPGVQRQDMGPDFKLNPFSHVVKKPNTEVTAEGSGAGNNFFLRIGHEGEDRENLG